MKELVIRRIKIIVAFILLVAGVLLANENHTYAAEKSSFWVEFVAVGQGDCVLIQCDGHYMMIDGGPSKASSKVFTVLKNKGIDTIDLMVATHPDEDHIGGLSGALNYASVDTVLSPVTEYDTKTFTSLSKYVAKQGKTFTVPKAGEVYNLGSARVNILGPVNSSSESNNQSIVLKVTYGATSFIFSGDAEEEEESSIIKKFKGLNCDVLKVAHHGSNSSTSKAWLNATKPTYAVIPVGKNDYGHPTQKTLDKLTKAGAIIYRTDLQGDIIFTSDGKKLSIETQKTASPLKPSTGEGKKDSFVVNGKNGKIHKVGGCSTPPTANPIYAQSYEEAESISISVAPNQTKRKCGNCYK